MYIYVVNCSLMYIGTYVQYMDNVLSYFIWTYSYAQVHSENSLSYAQVLYIKYVCTVNTRNGA